LVQNLVRFVHAARPRAWKVTSGLSLATVAIVFAIVIPFVSAGAAQAPVTLGTASSFGVLAGGGITNTGATMVTGDIGTFPTSTTTGGTLSVSGTNHGGDAVTQGAQADLTIADAFVAGESPVTPLVGGLAGQTLIPGVYGSASSIHLAGAVTLNAGGDPSATFVFQVGTRLTTAPSSQVDLVNGAQSCNVFWLVATSAELGSDSSFRGTVMAQSDVRVDHSSSIDGRILTVNGAVTLNRDTITTPSCPTTPAGTTTTTTVAAGPGPALGGPKGGKIVSIVTAKAPPAVLPTPPLGSVTVPSTTLPTATTTTSIPGPGVGGVNPKRALGSQGGGSPIHIIGVVAARTDYMWTIVEGALAVAFGATLLGFRRLRRRRVAA
jgi:hypothetical protein